LHVVIVLFAYLLLGDKWMITHNDY